MIFIKRVVLTIALASMAYVPRTVNAQAPRKVDWFRIVSEKEAILFKPGETAGVKVSIKKGSGESLTWQVVSRSEETVAASKQPIRLSADRDTAFEIAAGKLPEGFYVARLRVMNGGEMSRIGIVPIGVFGPLPKPDAVESLREPFFPFGVYDKYILNRDPVIQLTYLHAVCRRLRDAGLNTITSGNTLLPPTVKQLDVAHQYGIRVMVRLDWTRDERVLRHPAVLALMYGDEPSASKLEQYKKTYASIQASYPEKPLLTCVIGDGIGMGGKADPLRVWPELQPRLRLVRFYPIRKTNYGTLRHRVIAGYLPVSATFRLIDTHARGPWWFVPPAFGQNATDLRPEPYWRNPTGGEMKALVHLALAYGAKGIIAWPFQTHMGGEANLSPALVTQDTLAAQDDKFAAYSELARWVTKAKRHLLDMKFGGIEATADRVEIEVVPRVTSDDRKLLYLVNRDGNHAIETTVEFLGAQVDSVTDLVSSETIVAKVIDGRLKVRTSLGPGQGRLWEIKVLNGPVPEKRIDPDALQTFKDKMLRPYGRERTIYKLLQPLPLWWRFRIDESKTGERLGWGKAEFVDSAWPYLRVGRFWDRQGIRLSGVGWYRCTFTPSWSARKSRRAVLFFEAVDESAWVYLNGALIGTHSPDSIEGWNQSFAVKVAGKLKRGGNVLAVRVLNRKAAGGIYGKVALATPTDQKKPEFLPLW